MKKSDPQQPVAPIAFTVTEALAVARCGRNSLYNALASGALRGRKLGSKTLIHWHALLRKGYAADEIVDIAADYLLRSHDTPSLGHWLEGFESYQEAEDATAQPPM